MIKLGGLVTLKPINEAEDDKYVSIGFGRFKEKGKEDDKDAPTFKKDGDKYVPTKGDMAAKGGDSSAGKDVPKVNIFDKPKEEPSKEEPKSEPTKDSTGDRAGNPEVNKAVRKKAQRMGITPQKLGKDEYKKKMAQAAVAALTDANFHSEARQLVADLEGKPELAEKPDYPDVTDPEFNEKMKVINDKYNSVYSEPDDDAEEIGLTASNEARWDGQDALDSIAFDLKMNGFKNMAAKFQSVIKESKSTRLKDLV